MKEVPVSVDDVRAEAIVLLGDADDGVSLDDRTAALVGLAVCVSVAALDMDNALVFADRALDAGATPAQIHEVLVLVSGLGVHSLMEGSRRVADLLRERGDTTLSEPLDARRAELWEKYVGADPYWAQMEQEVPGFLDALVRLSPEAFEAFFVFCGVPWQTAALPGLTKELIAIAVDATPSHRYLPGMRLHLRNALRLGAGRNAVLQALEIAADAPPHRGVA